MNKIKDWYLDMRSYAYEMIIMYEKTSKDHFLKKYPSQEYVYNEVLKEMNENI